MNKNLAFNGFTLLELLFAIAMVGILAALALPA
ncbi:MAG: prepilin-type N-terminal cleavage/methylation domain-containing protein, partial [Kangiellaceae bacterium]|nr:prepilin-type N-terminal cleavage/methylation domain-containing protein [Kangiellaceae bacterium]